MNFQQANRLTLMIQTSGINSRSKLNLMPQLWWKSTKRQLLLSMDLASEGVVSYKTSDNVGNDVFVVHRYGRRSAATVGGKENLRNEKPLF